MELIFILVLPAALWAQSWYFLGLYSNPRTLGIIAATVGITLIGLAVFAGGDYRPLTSEPVSANAALSAFIIVWAIYSLMVAAVTLWGFDERTLGFYSLFLWVVSLLYAGYYFLGDELIGGAQEVDSISAILGIVSLLLAAIAALVFFYLAPPFSRMRQTTGWFELVVSIIIAVLGGLSILGLQVFL